MWEGYFFFCGGWVLKGIVGDWNRTPAARAKMSSAEVLKCCCLIFLSYLKSSIRLSRRKTEKFPYRNILMTRPSFFHPPRTNLRDYYTTNASKRLRANGEPVFECMKCWSSAHCIEAPPTACHMALLVSLPCGRILGIPHIPWWYKYHRLRNTALDQV